ncbi:MAG: DUF4037 domain-containing protein [Lachnospiraceae bacterium]|nr:DUF4037 domain-containing protein [Lachnospiraceae bacterium]
MNINEVLRELDSLPGGEDVNKTGEFLDQKIRQARDEGDSASELTLLNEMIGYLRYTGRHDDSYRYGEEAIKLCKDKGFDELSYATTLLNVATAKRAGGKLEGSLKDYREVESLYDKLVDKHDYLYAALYNNMSLLYQAMDDNEASAGCLEKALEIISEIDERRIEQAITRTNLAQAYLKLGRLDDAESELISADDIFEKEGGNDFHYPGCLNAMAELYRIKKDNKAAVKYYERALEQLRVHVGEENPNYLAVKESLAEARKALDEQDGTDDKSESQALKGLELSRKFYEDFGRAMIHECFAEYEDRITVGLVGRGSECYGFDDAMSRDHDYGPDFCMWLDDDVYEEIGDKLQKAYEELPEKYMGLTRTRILPPDGRRVGVIRTKEFYSRILMISEDILMRYVDGEDESGIFALVREEDLSQCTNGEVFKEGAGDFARIRNKLSYYPDSIWKRRIAEELHYSAQMGQYNYIRMLKRGEKVASEIALAGYMEHTMKLVYLINRKYAPYYKWLHRGMADLEKAAVIMDIFNAVYDMPKGDERIRMTTEIVASIIIEELERIGMAGGVPANEKYLDVYSQVIGSTLN